MIRTLLVFLVLAVPASAQVWEQAEYAGSFRVSAKSESQTGYESRFGYGGATMAVGRDGTTMWIEGHAHHQKVAEVAIPELVKSSDPRDMAIAAFVTPFFDITLGNRNGQIGGLHWDADRLWWTTEQFYDVSPTEHPTIGYTLSDFSASYGPWMADVGNKLTERYVSVAPLDFAEAHLGGRYLITGQAGTSGTAGSSQGFCATAVMPPVGDDPSAGTLSTMKLVFYPMDFPLPLEGTYHGHWYRADRCPSGKWVTINGEHFMFFTAIIGTGGTWYGPGNAPPEGDQYMVDRWSGAKGYHAPPYEERLYIYSDDELLRVAHGEIAPHDARPLQMVDLRPYLLRPGNQWVNLAYDVDKQRLYIAEPKGDGTQSRYESVAVIHAFDFPLDDPEPVDPCVELLARIADLEAQLLAAQEEGASAAARIADLEQRLEQIRTLTEGVLP